MKLYFSPGACSLSPMIAFAEAGIDYEAIPAPTKTKRLPDGTDYRTINPLGYVPYLVMDDGTGLAEGPAIVQYIADQAPQKHLAPANGTVPRYEMQAWLNFIATEIHKTFGALFNDQSSAQDKQAAKDKLIKRLTWVEGELAGKPYLMGDDFTVADGYLFTVTNWAKPMGIDLSGLKNLTEWRERVGARPGVKQAMQIEAAAKKG